MTVLCHRGCSRQCPGLLYCVVSRLKIWSAKAFKFPFFGETSVCSLHPPKNASIAEVRELCEIAECIGSYQLAAVCNLLAEDRSGWQGKSQIAERACNLTTNYILLQLAVCTAC